MRDVRVGRTDGYRGIGELLTAQPMKRLVESRANTAALLYQAVVAKRSGALARDVRVTTRIGGLANDRWVGRVIVGERITHDLPHEFGWSSGGQHHDGTEDLKKALGMLGGYV